MKRTLKYHFMIAGFLLVIVTKNVSCRPKGKGGSSNIGNSIKGIGRSTRTNGIVRSGSGEVSEIFFIIGGVVFFFVVLLCCFCLKMSCDNTSEEGQICDKDSELMD
ncbi:uncharacterized protein [Parasteatoda tepidariorum]|uniref:uncharacterized protein n=1 Tax=Parasteatoda tepidariorum TaxID=114398 RepID=UPI00077FB10B